MTQIAAGDRDALGRWFQEYKDSVYSFVFYRVGCDTELAADATQSTFMSALERMSDFDATRGNMTTWLQLLSRNVVRDLLTRQNRGQQLQAIWDRIDQSLRESYERIDSELLPEEALQRDETRKLVEMTLANLPPNYRKVLEDKYVDGQPLEAIASAGQTTIDAVKSMLRRARAAFREHFLAIAKVEVSDV